jgi:hypothetical protein
MEKRIGLGEEILDAGIKHRRLTQLLYKGVRAPLTLSELTLEGKEKHVDRLDEAMLPYGELAATVEGEEEFEIRGVAARDKALD